MYSDAGKSKTEVGVTLNQFRELLGILLEGIRQKNSSQLDAVQVDLFLIDTLKTDIVAALKARSQCNSEIVRNEDACLTALLIDVIRQSRVTNSICAAIGALGRNCEQRAVSMDPIAFKPEFVGAEWSSIDASETAGVDDYEMWFSVDLMKK